MEHAQSQCNGQAYRVGPWSKIGLDSSYVSNNTCPTKRPPTVRSVEEALGGARPVSLKSPVSPWKMLSVVGCRCCIRPHWIIRRHYGDHGDGYAGEEEPKAGLSDVRHNGVAVHKQSVRSCDGVHHRGGCVCRAQQLQLTMAR